MIAASPGRLRAQTGSSRWAGWIWAVPIAALGVALWLGVRALAQGGETVTVVFDSAHGMKAGDTKVVLKGVTVGQVDRVSLIDHASAVAVKLRLDNDVAPYLRAGTRFWLEGAEVSLSDPSSLKGLLAGPTIEMDPGSGAKTREFHGLDRSPADSPEGPQVPYLVRFPGAVGDLKPGAPVELRGFRVGQVSTVSLAYDAGTGRLNTPVTIALEPDRLHIEGVGTPSGGTWRPVVDAMLRSLIGQGLRARVGHSPPLVGAARVNLDFVPDAKAAELAPTPGGEEIPVAPEAGLQDITRKADQVMSRADAVMAKADQIPLNAIGGNMRAITTHLRTLTASPKLSDAIDHVDDATVALDRTVHRVSPDVEATVAKLRATASEADATVAAADQLIAGDPRSQDSDLPSALHELTQAARSIRVLANELQRHPEAIIKGKPHGQ